MILNWLDTLELIYFSRSLPELLERSQCFLSWAFYCTLCLMKAWYVISLLFDRYVYSFYYKLMMLFLSNYIYLIQRYKIAIVTGTFEQLNMMISTEKYYKICLVGRAFRNIWDFHKPYIGDYIEQVIFVAVDAPISDYVISLASLLGILSYFVTGWRYRDTG